ncbi:MAG TPA: hypothetical protein VGG36_12610 [Rhizomicrobium sp.]|jgi:uncharacterized membrane protein
MRIIGIGQVVFALALIGLGILGLRYDDFAMSWQPVPPGIPFHNALAYASAALLLLTGIGLFFARTAPLSALLETINLFAWILLLRADGIIAHPLSGGRWLGVGENLVLAAGAWTLWILCARIDGKSLLRFATGDRAATIARILFGIALPLIGQSHIVFCTQTAALIPGWIPAHTFFAYFTGVADIVAGIAVILMILPRLAAMLAAVMMSLFTILIWIPAVISAPTDRLSWTALMASTAISGGAWIVADSLRDKGWISWPRHA